MLIKVNGEIVISVGTGDIEITEKEWKVSIDWRKSTIYWDGKYIKNKTAAMLKIDQDNKDKQDKIKQMKEDLAMAMIENDLTITDFLKVVKK